MDGNDENDQSPTCLLPYSPLLHVPCVEDGSTTEAGSWSPVLLQGASPTKYQLELRCEQDISILNSWGFPQKKKFLATLAYSNTVICALKWDDALTNP